MIFPALIVTFLCILLIFDNPVDLLRTYLFVVVADFFILFPLALLRKTGGHMAHIFFSHLWFWFVLFNAY